MTCAEMRERVSAHVDGELPASQALEVADHLASCEECARDYEGMLETVRTLRESLVPLRAPDVLRARIRGSLRDESRPRLSWRPSSRRLPWRAIAAGIVLVITSASLTFLTTGHRSASNAVVDQVLASHIRSLMPDHLTDVRSNDQHNVKPWFNGRVDLSPNVPRLEDQGFPLVGGRLDYVNGRPVAVVVYGRRQHMINVFTWPTEASDADHERVTRQGYTLMHWRRAGVEYWVASDLNAQELQQFAALLH